MAKNIMTRKQSINYEKYLYKSHKAPIIAGIFTIIVLVVLVLIIVYQITEKSKLEKYQTIVKQIDADTRVMSVISDSDRDDDSDGITNKDEEAKGTNPFTPDTDGDGISDENEISLGTDPLNPDSDNDGVSDGYELMAGLDPSEKWSDGSTMDSERIFSIKKTCGDLTADMKGTAHIYGAVVDTINLVSFNANTAIVSDVYEIYGTQMFDSCTLTFKLSDESFVENGLSVFRFNTENNVFEAVKSTVDSSTKTVSAEINAYGTYVVGMGQTINAVAETRVHFLIDNSGSMYSKDVLASSPENDVKFKRLDFAEDLIEKFDESYQCAVSKFTASYTLLQDFTSDKKALSDALDRIKNEDEYFNGTYIQSALMNCIDSFDSTDKKTVNIIVMLTDGDTTEETSPDIKKIAAAAEDKNIIILTVSIGNDIDKSVLKNIAEQTDGKYYSASDANALNDIHNQIVATLNYDKVTVENDSNEISGVGYMLYNTGFVPAVNGYSFADFRTNEADTVSFGLAVFARDWFTGNLNLSLGDTQPDDDGGKKYSSDGYDLRDTTVEDDYKAKSGLRSLSFIAASTDRFTDCLTYLDFEKKGETLSVKENIRSEALSKGLTVLSKPINNEELKWGTVQLLGIDTKNGIEKIETNYGKGEAEFYRAISCLNVYQWKDSSVTYALSDGDKCFDTIKDRLYDGVPAVVIIDGKRAANAVALIRDANSPDTYILRVYDAMNVDLTKDIVIRKYAGAEFAKDGSIKEYKNFYKATMDGEEISLAISDIDI